MRTGRVVARWPKCLFVGVFFSAKKMTINKHLFLIFLMMFYSGERVSFGLVFWWKSGYMHKYTLHMYEPERGVVRIDPISYYQVLERGKESRKWGW